MTKLRPSRIPRQNAFLAFHYALVARARSKLVRRRCVIEGRELALEEGPLKVLPRRSDSASTYNARRLFEKKEKNTIITLDKESITHKLEHLLTESAALTHQQLRTYQTHTERLRTQTKHFGETSTLFQTYIRSENERPR